MMSSIQKAQLERKLKEITDKEGGFVGPDGFLPMLRGSGAAADQLQVFADNLERSVAVHPAARTYVGTYISQLKSLASQMARTWDRGSQDLDRLRKEADRIRDQLARSESA
jgi:ABC-type transporter Mla subunit MlaD